MPRTPLAEIAKGLRQAINQAVLYRALIAQTDAEAVGVEAAQELLDAVAAHGLAMAGQLGAAKASRLNPALGDLRDEAETELRNLQVAGLGWATAMSVAGFRPNLRSVIVRG